VVVRNNYFFRNLGNVQLNWQLLQDGQPVDKGTIASLPIAARDSATITLSLKKSISGNHEYFLDINYVLKEPEPFLERGYAIAAEQFLVGANTRQAVPTTGKTGTVQVAEKDGQLTLKGKDFSIVFDMKQGVLQSYTLKGQQLLQQGPQPAFWRAPTDNDIGAGYNHNLRNWRNVYEQSKELTATSGQTANGYEVVFSKKLLNGDAVAGQTFTVYSDGAVKVENRFKAVSGKHKLLYRLGNDLQLSSQLNNIRFYGRGPWENYRDRKSASFVGIYAQTVDQQYFPYARPQESGNKSDVRWVALTNAQGKGLRIEMIDSLLNFSALPYSLDDLDPEADKQQYHSGELVKKDKVYMHIDLQQSGVQGIDSWGSQPLEQYRISYTDHQYRYWIKPVR